jgi:lysyl-tRNA synthetase class 2
MNNRLWQPSCSIDALKRRSILYSTLRHFFSERQVLEVETPVLSSAGSTDVHLESIVLGTGDGLAYLQTSPEFAMKRLLAAGSGAIFQICKSFRAAERGRKHNPEFTMLEWYRPGFNLDELMNECSALLVASGITMPPHKIEYREAFLKFADIDPFKSSDEAIRYCAESCSGLSHTHWERDTYLDLILSHLVEPNLGKYQPEFMVDYPASQAALAKIYEKDGVLLARRFELYIHGLEIANGYQELTDANEQLSRFQQDNRARKNANLPQITVDEKLIAALGSGMPECAGVALGIDRLLMVLSEAKTIDEVIAFPIERA